MNSETAFIVGIGHDEQEYTVNGVRYAVASRYVPVDYHRDNQQTLSQCLRHYIGSDFADLSVFTEEGMLTGEDACSAAGKED